MLRITIRCLIIIAGLIAIPVFGFSGDKIVLDGTVRMTFGLMDYDGKSGGRSKDDDRLDQDYFTYSRRNSDGSVDYDKTTKPPEVKLTYKSSLKARAQYEKFDVGVSFSSNTPHVLDETDHREIFNAFAKFNFSDDFYIRLGENPAIGSGGWVASSGLKDIGITTKMNYLGFMANMSGPGIKLNYKVLGALNIAATYYTINPYFITKVVGDQRDDLQQSIEKAMNDVIKVIRLPDHDSHSTVTNLLGVTPGQEDQWLYEVLGVAPGKSWVCDICENAKLGFEGYGYALGAQGGIFQGLLTETDRIAIGIHSGTATADKRDGGPEYNHVGSALNIAYDLPDSFRLILYGGTSNREVFKGINPFSEITDTQARAGLKLLFGSKFDIDKPLDVEFNGSEYAIQAHFNLGPGKIIATHGLLTIKIAMQGEEMKSSQIDHEVSDLVYDWPLTKDKKSGLKFALLHTTRYNGRDATPAGDSINLDFIGASLYARF